MNRLFENYSADWSQDSLRLHNTPTETARKIYYYIQECGYFKTRFPYFTERENLNSFLAVCTIDGAGILEYDANTYELHPGELFLIDCSKRHRYFCKQERQWEFNWFHFNGVSARGMYEETVKNGFRIMKDEFGAASQINRIIALTARKTVRSEPLISNLITGILTELILANGAEDDAPILLPPEVKKAAQIISRQFSDSAFRLEELPESLAYSHTYLSREFKRHMGVTMKEYLISCRLDYAKELLKYAELPVAEIAFSIGMNHVSHFINLFKEREGMTPAAYRKEWDSL